MLINGIWFLVDATFATSFTFPPPTAIIAFDSFEMFVTFSTESSVAVVTITTVTLYFLSSKISITWLPAIFL